MHLLPADCLKDNAYFCPAYFNDPFRRHDILAALSEHVSLVARSVGVGLLIALPLAVAVRTHRRSRNAALGLAGLLYTIPSVAAFALLVPFLGTTHDTAPVIVLSAYNLLVLLRNTLVGLDGVPADALEAARGLGYGRWRMLWRIELPLALPAIVAGLRIATVSTVGIATVAAVIGFGGLGQLLLQGLESSTPFHAEIATALFLCIALAVIADLLLLGVQRLLTPWARRGGAGSG